MACKWGALLLCAALTGCNKPEPRYQTLATVNGEAITAGHVRLALVTESSGSVNDAQALDSLVNDRLLQAEALRMKLERDPRVALALENARSQILAQAYVEAAASQMQKPSAAEIDDYFRAHPELFANRRLYTLHVLSLATADAGQALMQAVDVARSVEDIAAWLDGHNRSYLRNRLSRSSGELPPELAARLAGDVPGRLFSVADGGNLHVVEVVAAIASPLGRQEAAPYIERDLLERKNREFSRAEIARLRSIGKLEYAAEAVPQVAGRGALKAHGVQFN